MKVINYSNHWLNWLIDWFECINLSLRCCFPSTDGYFLSLKEINQKNDDFSRSVSPDLIHRISQAVSAAGTQCTFPTLCRCHQPMQRSCKFLPITYQHSFAWSAHKTRAQVTHVVMVTPTKTRLCAFESDSLNNEICSNLLPTWTSSLDFPPIHFAAIISPRQDISANDLRMLHPSVLCIEGKLNQLRRTRNVREWIRDMFHFSHAATQACILQKTQHLLRRLVSTEENGNFCRVCE